jgi:5-methylcytosine-specific restriction endonuclease McrA
MSLNNARCLVLNASYQPLTIISAKRALILVFEEKAKVLEEHPSEFVHSPNDVWPLPTKILLKKQVTTRSVHKTPAILTQRNLFVRDNYTCNYCERHISNLHAYEILTRDHIIPKDKGGPNTWENVTTACSTCNGKKANWFLHECGMVLKKKPTVPMVYDIMLKTKFKKYMDKEE